MFNSPFMNFFMPGMFQPFMPINNFWQTNPFMNYSMPSNNSVFNIGFNNRNYSSGSIFDNNKSSYSDNSTEDTRTLEDRIKLNVKTETSSSEKNKETVLGAEYNKKNGKMLAKNVLAGLPDNRDPNNPLCARYVKRAIVKSGLGPYINGNGEYCQYILRSNSNFKEVDAKGSDLSSLPAGCIIVYDKYDAGYGEDGHVEITLGDGRACSDIITPKIHESDNAHVFVPV